YRITIIDQYSFWKLEEHRCAVESVSDVSLASTFVWIGVGYSFFCSSPGIWVAPIAAFTPNGEVGQRGGLAFSPPSCFLCRFYCMNWPIRSSPRRRAYQSAVLPCFCLAGCRTSSASRPRRRRNS